MKAFPLYFKWDDDQYNGMDLRDYFATKAMNAFLVDVGVRVDKSHLEEIATRAYEMADLMMKAKEK